MPRKLSIVALIDPNVLLCVRVSIVSELASINAEEIVGRFEEYIGVVLVTRRLSHRCYTSLSLNFLVSLF